MKRKHVANELVEARREAAAIARAHAATHHFPLPLDVDVRAGNLASSNQAPEKPSGPPRRPALALF